MTAAFVLALLVMGGPGSAPFEDAPARDPARFARLTFTKEFPRSEPDFYRIELAQDGQARYLTAPDDPRAVEFHVSPALTQRAFELAAQLNNFRGASLETRKKVASLGKKTLVYENAGERYETAFNYSENPDAMALADLFEKISNTQQQILALDRLIHFDKLGVMKQLLNLESALNRRNLAEPALLVPMLEEISKNRSYMRIAQERARIILNKIYDQKPEN